jgi:hypothetical protein
MKLRLSFMALALVCAGQASAASNDACMRQVKTDFTKLITDFVETLVVTRGSGNYNTSENPRSFALCLDWNKSTPKLRYGAGHGFASRQTSTNVAIVDSRALEWCVDSDGAKSGRCKCEIVSRDGKTDLQFPPDWAGKQCP